jgi:hypothetical protein
MFAVVFPEPPAGGGIFKGVIGNYCRDLRDYFPKAKSLSEKWVVAGGRGFWPPPIFQRDSKVFRNSTDTVMKR